MANTKRKGRRTKTVQQEEDHSSTSNTQESSPSKKSIDSPKIASASSSITEEILTPLEMTSNPSTSDRSSADQDLPSSSMIPRGLLDQEMWASTEEPQNTGEDKPSMSERMDSPSSGILQRHTNSDSKHQGQGKEILGLNSKITVDRLDIKLREMAEKINSMLETLERSHMNESLHESFWRWEASIDCSMRYNNADADKILLSDYRLWCRRFSKREMADFTVKIDFGRKVKDLREELLALLGDLSY